MALGAFACSISSEALYMSSLNGHFSIPQKPIGA